MSTNFLHGVEVVEVDDGLRPIETIKSSVIGIVGTAPDADPERFPLNTPALITGNRTEAAKLGKKGTLPWAMDGIFDQAGAMVAVIRVENSEAKTVEITRSADAIETITGATNVETITSAIFGDWVYHVGEDFTQYGNQIHWLGSPQLHNQTVTRGATATDTLEKTPVLRITKVQAGVIRYLKGRDFILEDNKVKWVAGGNAPAQDQDYEVSYEHDIAPQQGDVYTLIYRESLTENQIISNVIGGVNTATDQFEGVHAFKAAESVVKVVPKILITPGFSHHHAVVSEMQGIAESLKSIIVVDGPNTTDADAISYREQFGTPRTYIVDPHAMVWSTEVDNYIFEPASARVAGIISKMDNTKGFWWSPSNQIINGISGTSRHIQYALGDKNSRANYLNEHEVATIIQDSGYRLWGNRTTAMDQKWMFLCVRRTADMINESIKLAHRWAVDRPISRNLVNDILDSVNAYIQNLVARGAIVGGEAWADSELNTPDQVILGKLSIDFKFSAYYPAEHITFRSHLVDDYLEEIFLDEIASAAA